MPANGPDPLIRSTYWSTLRARRPGRASGRSRRQGLPCRHATRSPSERQPKARRRQHSAAAAPDTPLAERRPRRPPRPAMTSPTAEPARAAHGDRLGAAGRARRRAGAGRRAGRGPPPQARRALSRRHPGRAERAAEGARQRHRLPVPAGQRLRLADRLRRAGRGAAHAPGRRRRALPRRPGQPQHVGLLHRPPLRRAVGRAPPRGAGDRGGAGRHLPAAGGARRARSTGWPRARPGCCAASTRGSTARCAGRRQGA